MAAETNEKETKRRRAADDEATEARADESDESEGDEAQADASGEEGILGAMNLDDGAQHVDEGGVGGGLRRRGQRQKGRLVERAEQLGFAQVVEIRQQMLLEAGEGRRAVELE